MNKKFIPYDKMSKRSRKEIDKERRNDWGEINPVSKVIPDKREKLREKAENKE